MSIYRHLEVGRPTASRQPTDNILYEEYKENNIQIKNMQKGIHLKNLKDHSTAITAVSSKDFKHMHRPATMRRRSKNFLDGHSLSRGMNLVATWPVGGEAVMVCFIPALPTIR